MIRQSARAEFEAARLEQDPETARTLAPLSMALLSGWLERAGSCSDNRKGRAGCEGMGAVQVARLLVVGRDCLQQAAEKVRGHCPAVLSGCLEPHGLTRGCLRSSRPSATACCTPRPPPRGRRDMSGGTRTPCYGCVASSVIASLLCFKFGLPLCHNQHLSNPRA